MLDAALEATSLVALMESLQRAGRPALLLAGAGSGALDGLHVAAAFEACGACKSSVCCARPLLFTPLRCAIRGASHLCSRSICRGFQCAFAPWFDRTFMPPQAACVAVAWRSASALERRHADVLLTRNAVAGLGLLGAALVTIEAAARKAEQGKCSIA